jgi:hypothetical protein
LEYYEGATGLGLVPVRKSIHLVIGSAVHAGLAVLLEEGGLAIESLCRVESLADSLHLFFDSPAARTIEDRAVAAALADLGAEMGEAGVELDPEEQAVKQGGQGGIQLVNSGTQGGTQGGTQIDFAGLVPGQSSNSASQQDSPIVIEFEGMVPLTIDPASVVIGLPEPLTPETSMGNVAVVSPGYQSQDDYLKEEIGALVEGMTRAWARRRWRGMLESFEIIEVEREGDWVLSAWDEPHDLGCHSSACQIDHHRELHFLSRHDALLLERSTGYLYLQSFKTTGSWDRRKEMDAQVDMQGLSEAVDVEKRMGEAWTLVHEESHEDGGVAAAKRLSELVSSRAADWLAGLPDPPQILGVRYEYLLKGSRRKDKKDAMQPDRYVQDSILCRAWKQEGITAEDRRWAWTYEWQEEGGKTRRLDYRSWQKAPVWRTMAIAEWIDLLDRGLVQEGALGEDGEPMDALAEQFVPVIVVYRSRDSFYDLMESLEAQEVQVAKDVAVVRQEEKAGGYAAKRSALNRMFPRSLAACSYPGKCWAWECCHGSPEIQVSPEASGLFVVRTPNHPTENNPEKMLDNRPATE